MSVNQLICFWIILLQLSILHTTSSLKKGYYTIVAPGNIQPESDFHVSLTLNDYHKSCGFNISLTSFVREEKLYDFGTIEIEPGTTKLVKLKAPPLDYGIGNLEITGIRGIISKDTAHISFRREELWAFIQTDKQKYNPGELVQFRVICLDQLTRPAKLNDDIKVEILDDEFNLVKSFVDMKFVQGVFKAEFQLSNSPIFGLWKIKVDGNRIYKLSTFEVGRYLLPKFDVKINAEIVANEFDKNQVQIDIAASYFYGEPVNGNLSLSIINTAVPDFTISILPTITREFQIEGNTTILLDLEEIIEVNYKNKTLKPLNAYSKSPSQFVFSIEASVIDDLSEETVDASTDLFVYETPFTLELQAPETFYSDEIIQFEIKATLRDLTNAIVEESKFPIEIIVGCSFVENYRRNYNDFDKFRFEYKNEIGKDFTIVNVTNKDYNECFVYAEYQGIKSKTEQMFKKVQTFEIDILTESPEEGKELEVKISNPEPFEEFSYEIVARKDIIQSGRVVVPGNQTSYTFHLNVTFSMVPKITIYAHHIKDTTFGGHLKDVVIKRALPNSIEIQTEEETKPGSVVNINVTTNEGSYVGLMGLDSSGLKNIIKENFFDEDLVNMELGPFNSARSYPIPLYGVTVEIITFSNVFPPGTKQHGPGGDDGPAGGGEEEERIRNFFPDSWLFKDFERTPEGGFSLKEMTSDSITTWALSGFSLHPEKGLNVTRNTTYLRVFQKFFLTIDFPSLVKEGEIIELTIFINNYMDEDALTNLTIEINSDELEILENPQQFTKTNLSVSKLISKKNREKLLYFVKPLKPGNFNVTVKAITPLANDAIQKTLNVQPQGIPYTRSKIYVVHLPEESNEENEISIDIPKTAVLGSKKIEISVVGDIFRPLLEDLQKLAEVPYGNNEDNVRLIITNSIVLKYLKTLNNLDESLEKKIKLNLELGYQNELSFKYLDGSFGLFERKSERTGDIWQTIFALWGLQQADEFISIDSKVLKRGLEYLKSKQQENGCYKSEGSKSEDVKFTAFGLMVFLMEEKSRKTYGEVIAKGLSFLYENSDDLEYSPILILSAYVLHLGKHEKAGDYLKKLTKNTEFSDKQTLWTKSDTLQSHLEAIAGILMNLFESQTLSKGQKVLQIVRGLIAPKVEESSITHLVALRAMVAFARQIFANTTHLDINFIDDRNNSKNIQLNNQNSQVLQKFELGKELEKLKIQSKGHGFAMVEVKYNFNLLPENQSSNAYNTNISIEILSKKFVYLTICSKMIRNNEKNKFLIMEVSPPFGYAFSEGNFNDIENQDEFIRSIQYSASRDKVEIYFDADNDACIKLETLKKYTVFNSKPGYVIMHGERDKDKKSINSFMINEE